MSGAQRQSPNTTRHLGAVSVYDRAAILKQRGALVWLTGLSGAGKSTIAVAAEAQLIARGHAAYRLDGDNLRHGLNGDLGFSAEDREENLRRVAHIGALLVDAGLITFAAFISPSRSGRDQVRALCPPGSFIEVFIDTPLALCEERDPKGLYQKARAGEIANFTGISAPYEPPLEPALRLAPGESAEQQAERIILWLEEEGFLASIAKSL